MKKTLQILCAVALLSLPLSVDAKNRIHVDYVMDEVASVVTDKPTMDRTRNIEMNYGVKPMSSDAAMAELASFLDLDEDGRTPGGIKLNFDIEGTEILKITKNNCETVTLVRAFEDRGSHIATYGRWAVGQYTGELWKYDVITDSYKNELIGVLPLRGDIFTTADDKKAIGIVYDCDPYEAWANDPVAEVDMTVYGTGKDHWSTPGVEDVLVFAANGSAKVSFTSGYWDTERNIFVPQSTMYATNLKMGECVHVWFEGAEGMPKFAIVVEQGDEQAIYPLTYNGKGGRRDPHYLVAPKG
ncbi:MAG: hypothetical protein Q4D21_04950 [Phascolarctobacterium sp.]|nr:hypothetical protein [Phascolarctobacterium sp.]